MRIINNAAERASYDDSIGAFTLLDTAPAGRMRISNQVDVDDTLTVHAAAGDDWEIAVVVVASAGVLVRQYTVAGSNGIAPVLFAGEVTVTATVEVAGLPLIDRGGAARAIGNSAVAIGLQAAAVGDHAMAFGAGAIAQHESAICMGRDTVSWSPYVESMRNAFRWAGRASTFGAVTRTLGLNGAGTGDVEVPEYAAVFVRTLVIGTREGGACYAAEITGVARRVGASSIEFVVAPLVSVVASSAGVTASATMVVSGAGLLRVSVTGETGAQWWWSANMHGVVVGV